MERTGSAQRLWGTAERVLTPESLEVVQEVLGEVMAGADEMRGAHVEEALARLGRRGSRGKPGVWVEVFVDGRRVRWWREALAVLGEALGEAWECGDWWGCLRTALRVVRGR